MRSFTKSVLNSRENIKKGSGLSLEMLSAISTLSGTGAQNLRTHTERKNLQGSKMKKKYSIMYKNIQMHKACYFQQLLYQRKKFFALNVDNH